jgi:hypothetical protein
LDFDFDFPSIKSTGGSTSNTNSKNLYGKTCEFNMAFGYGAGIHIERVLLEIGGYRGITNHSAHQETE